MNRLSDAERVLGHDVSASMPGRWYAEEVVEAIVAARLASVKALLDERDEWLLDDHPKPWPIGIVHSALVTTDEVRAVLGSDAHTEQKGTGE